MTMRTASIMFFSFYAFALSQAAAGAAETIRIADFTNDFRREVELVILPEKKCTSLLEIATEQDLGRRNNDFSLKRIVSSAAVRNRLTQAVEPELVKIAKPMKPRLIPGFPAPPSEPSSFLYWADLPYSVRRLLARYSGFIQTGGDINSPRAFCKEYLFLQRRDRKLRESGFGIQVFETDDQWHQAEKFGFTEGELSAIRKYTQTAGAHDLNTALWNDTPLSLNLSLFKDTLVSALKRLPDFKGTVRRAAKVPKKFLPGYEVGKTVVFKGFTSTSKGDNWRRFSGDHFTITSERGKLIRDIAYLQDEEEVLFPPNTKFKVIEREDRGEYFHFTLEEIDNENDE